MSSVVSAMNSAAGQARSAGYNMGMGFYNGLSAMSGSIIGLAMSIASRAASAMRSALRIHSPSRVTAQIGGYTGEGFYDGMKDWVRPVAKIGEQLGLAGVPSINDSDLTRLGTMSAGSYSFDGGELSVSQKPAELTLNLGSQSYKTFVEDIMNVHNQQLDLSMNY